MISAKNNPARQQAASQTSSRTDLVFLGEFGRAHGLKGEVRLKSFTADPAAIADYRPLLSEDGRPFIITSVRQTAGNQPDLLVVRVDGVTSREGAEALNRITLHIERDRLPAIEEADEFLYADLIGLEAVDPVGAKLGTISDVLDYGGGEILQIEPAGILVPFTKAFVPAIDFATGKVVVDYAESSESEASEEAGI